MAAAAAAAMMTQILDDVEYSFHHTVLDAKSLNLVAAALLRCSPLIMIVSNLDGQRYSTALSRPRMSRVPPGRGSAAPDPASWNENDDKQQLVRNQL